MVFLLGVFARIVKVTDVAQVINFREKAHGKIHPRKVDKNNRESMNLLLFVCLLFFFCFFQQNSKTKFIVPSLTQHQKQKVFYPFFFVAFVLAFLEFIDITVHEESFMK